MAHLILDALSEKVPLNITPSLARAIVHFVISYETYGTNMQAFTSPYLGVTSCVFREADRSGFFELFNLDETTLKVYLDPHTRNRNTFFGISAKSLQGRIQQFFTKLSNKLLTLGISTQEMRKIVHDIPSIDNNFKVISDPFNVFAVWVAHNVINANLPNALKQEATSAVLRLLQYKFFTSLVNYRFKYKPNEAVMQTTYESLSDKYDIKKFGTWKGLMDARIAEFISPGSIHYDALVNFHEDKEVLYIITDIETRIRAQINTFVEEYMRVKDTEDIIGSYASVGTDSEGKQRLYDNEQGLDMAIASVYQDTLSVSRFLDDKAIRLVSGLFTTIRPEQVKQLLIAYSEKSVKLAKAGDDDKVVDQKDGSQLYVGPHIFIQTVIQQTYRYCRNNNVNMKVPTEIIKAAKNVYSSSRVAEPGIVNVRVTSLELILELQPSRRETTVSALKIAFVLYFILLSLKYL